MFGLRRMSNRRKSGAMKAKTCHVIDLTKAPYMTYGAGVVKGNPKRCLTCGQPIRSGEAWRTYTSAEDPEYGRYSIIVHSWCTEKPKK